MNETEVKEYLWKKFLVYMHGQTVGKNSDGSFDYYERDVKRFI